MVNTLTLEVPPTPLRLTSESTVELVSFGSSQIGISFGAWKFGRLIWAYYKYTWNNHRHSYIWAFAIIAHFRQLNNYLILFWGIKYPIIDARKLTVEGRSVFKLQIIAQNRYDSFIPRREGSPLLSIVVSRIGGSIQRSHVYIPIILWLFKSTVLLINLFEFGLLFISEFSTKFSLINLFEFEPLFMSEFSTKFSTASLIDFVQRSAFWIRSILRNCFEIRAEANFPQIYLWIHVKCSSTSFKQRLWQKKNAFNIANLRPPKLSGTVVQWSRSCLHLQINKVRLPAKLFSFSL